MKRKSREYLQRMVVLMENDTMFAGNDTMFEENDTFVKRNDTILQGMI